MHSFKSSQHSIPALEETKKSVDDYLVSVFKKRQEQAAHININYKVLWIAIEKLFTAGGKRLRPHIMLLSHKAFGGNGEGMVSVASAFELLHQAMLIHDDIIDRDTMRYGIKNLTGQYEEHYKDLLTDPSQRRHFAESSALLAGDLLISEAHTQLALGQLNPQQLRMAQQILATAVFHVAGGELIDTEASFRLNEIDPLTVAVTKTSSYSFTAPLVMGASLAGADEKQLSILKKIGHDLGIGFQLRDDIIGVFGDENTTGKSTDNDLREGKQTLLIKEFERIANAKQKDSFYTYFGKQQASKTDLQTLRKLLEQTHARENIEKSITLYQTKIQQAIESLDMTPEYHDTFKNLVVLCLQREK